LDTSQTTNGGDFVVDKGRPYIATVKIEGVATLLLHAWNCDSVEAKAGAVKGSSAKKTDDVESYVVRASNGEIGIPASYFRGMICGAQGAAKYRQDPRSPRKSALDLYRAGAVIMTEIASLGVKKWDLLDKRREVVMRAGITRVRPAMLAGWRCEFDIQCILPEYISPHDLHSVLVDCGRLCGLGDHRPTYGRFAIVGYEVRQL
jgi:hypothetical protein